MIGNDLISRLNRRVGGKVLYVALTHYYTNIIEILVKTDEHMLIYKWKKSGLDFLKIENKSALEVEKFNKVIPRAEMMNDIENTVEYLLSTYDKICVKYNEDLIKKYEGYREDATA